MNFKKIIVCLAGGLAFCAGLHADDLAMNNTANVANTVVLPNNPYATIVTRNVFGLNPPIVDTNPPVDATLPKITPNGIVAVFGRLQVLFKVTPTAKGGKSAEDEYYTMSEGERQDEIEVMHIDNDNEIVTFKNHGTVQTLPLATASSSSGSAPSSSPANRIYNPAGGNNPDNQGGPGNRITRFGNRGGGPGGFNRRGGNNQNNQDNTGAATDDGSLNLRSIPTRVYQPEASQMTPDQAAQTIEMEHAQALDNNDPKAALFPPTKYSGQY